MKKFLNVLLVFIAFASNISSQEVIKTELDSVTLKALQQEAQYTYKLFLNAVRNAVDPNTSREEYYRLGQLFPDLFINVSKKYIDDIIDKPNPQKYNPSEYPLALIAAKHRFPIFDKGYKRSDETDFKYNAKVIMNGKNFSVYSGTLYAKERILNTRKIDKSVVNQESFNAFEEGLIKKFTFKYRPNSNLDYAYDVRLNRVSILPKNNIDYKEIDKEIETSEYKWSDEEEAKHIEFLIADAKKNGIDLKRSTKVLDSIPLVVIDIEPDSTKFQGPTFVNYIIPGPGHMKFGKHKNIRRLKTGIYSTIFIGSLSYSTYNFINYRKQYNQHQEAETFREANKYLDKANASYRKSLISGGVTVATLIANAVHLKWSHNVQLRRFRKSGYDIGMESLDLQSNYVSISLAPSPETNSLSLKLIF